MANLAARIFDGLVNLVSGAGTSVDKRTHGFYHQTYLQPTQIEAAYRTSWLMRKLVDLPPFDMTRAGRDWQCDGATTTAIEAEEKRLGLWSKVRQALVLGRLGGGLIVMGVGAEDAALPIKPRSLTKGSLRYLHVMTRWQVSLGPVVMDPTDPLFGQPSYFEIGFGKGLQTRVHPSRVVAFKGRQVPGLTGARSDEWFWGDSEMMAVQDAVKNADAALNGFASLIDEAKLDTVSIPGLTQLVSTTEGEALVLKRVQVANAMKSTHNTRILDAGRKDQPGETWETRQIAWAGMPDMIRTYLAAVAGAADIPATRLLGKSPDGMNATGSGDEANYVTKIKSDQQHMLRPALDQIDAVLLPSAGITPSADTWYEFAPLVELTEAERATAFKLRVDAIVALQSTGTIPDIALDKAVQNTAVEEGWLVGLDGALAELSIEERFPSLAEKGDTGDPSALQAETVPPGGGDGSVPVPAVPVAA